MRVRIDIAMRVSGCGTMRVLAIQISAASTASACGVRVDYETLVSPPPKASMWNKQYMRVRGGVGVRMRVYEKCVCI